MDAVWRDFYGLMNALASSPIPIAVLSQDTLQRAGQCWRFSAIGESRRRGFQDWTERGAGGFASTAACDSFSVAPSCWCPSGRAASCCRPAGIAKCRGDLGVGGRGGPCGASRGAGDKVVPGSARTSSGRDEVTRRQARADLVREFARDIDRDFERFQLTGSRRNYHE